MTIQAKDFTFNDISLSSFDTGYLLVSFDNSASNSGVSIINTSINHSELNYDSPIVSFYNRLPDDVLSFDISICRSDGQYLTKDNITELQDWLFAPKTPKVAYFTPYDNDTNAVYTDVDFIGMFSASSLEDIGQVNKFGISFTFVNISPYAFTQPYTYNIDNTSGVSAVEFYSAGTHVGEIIYPKITISPSETGILRLFNDYGIYDEPLSIKVTSGQTVIIKDRNLYLQDGSLYSFSNLNNFNWVAIRDGQNNIWGEDVFCAIQIETRYFENVGV